jgi:hypothetical protein
VIPSVERKIQQLLAHQMEQNRLHSVYWEVFSQSAIGVSLVPINMLYARRIAKKLPAKWGVRDLGDWAVTPILVLAMTIFSFLLMPINNSLSRI